MNKTFEITSGEVYITDPCYDRKVIENGGIKLSVKNGQWRTDVDIQNQGIWGDRVVSLTATHEQCSWNINDYYELPGLVGVDSGQAGVFDVACYPEGKTGDYYDDTSFYRNVCDANSLTENYGVMTYGCVSSTGFGDGSYIAYAATNSLHEVISIKIVFITHEYESDESAEEELQRCMTNASCG